MFGSDPAAVFSHSRSERSNREKRGRYGVTLLMFSISTIGKNYPIPKLTIYEPILVIFKEIFVSPMQNNALFQPQIQLQIEKSYPSRCV